MMPEISEKRLAVTDYLSKEERTDRNNVPLGVKRFSRGMRGRYTESINP